MKGNDIFLCVSTQFKIICYVFFPFDAIFELKFEC